MDELEQNNYAELCGTLAAPPVLSHENRQERFFTFPLETQRLSGTIDRVNVIVRERRCALVQQPPRAGREAGHHGVRARHLAQRRTV